MTSFDTAPQASDRAPSSARRLWLTTEFAVLFLGAPLAMATIMPPQMAFSVIFGLTVVGVALLAITPGFRWRSLIEGPVAPHWRETLLFALVTAAATTALVLALRPWAFLGFPQRNTELWLLVIALYPLLSVLPQELLYRPLFFKRYGVLFPSWRVAMVANAVCFGLAHAFFHNWFAVVLSGVGGAAFAYAYVVRGSFPLACLWHSLAGQIVFTTGLGVYFYHGAIPT